ncbi:AraC family transcriptional regulator [Mesorhizobium loti]|uniref:AraC family transcriptional regulator n=1 Tax=Mesorhizobium loti R88b TaxID=935548 RepID=A0A6M7WUU7_RHILI|nr:AraC family transcriptional regulator [Mesorhizobium loti]QKD05326.1 AraC family transcriptional regulator [Mesorhizobium loti R88b]
MEPLRLAELRELIARRATPDGAPHSVLPGLTLLSASAPTSPIPEIAEPTFALVVQGAKRIGLGGQVFQYGVGQYLIVSVDLPLEANVVDATADVPFLGLGFALRPEAIANLLLEAGTSPMGRTDPPGIAVSHLTSDLLDPVIRLLRLLDRPADVAVLASAIEREILWRLIEATPGAMIRQIGIADSRMSQIGRAIRWLRGNFAEPVRIEVLAQVASMSVTSFHRHFRRVTSMTPIQYQKHIRLQSARSRLASTPLGVAEIGFVVGYDSPSQFSREYRRLFGRPPGEDRERFAGAKPAG